MWQRIQDKLKQQIDFFTEMLREIPLKVQENICRTSAYDNPFDSFDIMSYTYNFPVYEEPPRSIKETEVKLINCPSHNMKFIQICADNNCTKEGLR